MPITYKTGDATRPEAAGQKTIVHICNDVGGWGRGFVVAISRRWPEPERRYRAWHAGKESQPFALGEVQFVQVEPEITVANVIGQHGLISQQAMPPIRYDAVHAGLRRVGDVALAASASIHMPRIGCGHWEEIEPLIAEELSAGDIPVTVYDLPT